MTDRPPPVLSQPPRRPRTFEQWVADGEQFLEAQFELEALTCFEAAHAQRPQDARIMSQYSVLLSQQRGQPRRALELARRAVETQPDCPKLHVNLAVVLLGSGQRDAAVEALRVAMAKFPKEECVRRMLGVVGIRRPPPLRALHRSHPVNKYLGMITWALRPRPRALPARASLPPPPMLGG